MKFKEFVERVEQLFGQQFQFQSENDCNSETECNHKQVRSHLGRVVLVPTVYGPTGQYDRVEYMVRGHKLDLRPRYLAARYNEPSQDFADVFEHLELAMQVQERRRNADLEKIDQHIAELEKIRKCPVHYKRHDGARPTVEVFLANSDIQLFIVHGDYIKYEPSSAALEVNGFTDMRSRAPNKAETVAEMMLLPITDKERLRVIYVPRRADIFVSDARYVVPAPADGNPYVEINNAKTD